MNMMLDVMRLRDYMKPKLFKRYGVWHCKCGDKLTVGKTPKMAYDAMVFVGFGFRDSMYG